MSVKICIRCTPAFLALLAKAQARYEAETGVFISQRAAIERALAVAMKAKVK